MKMRILVIGAGVIGCELTHELCKGEKNSVTLLARGSWKQTIDEHGLVIRHYGQLRTTIDHVNTIEMLKPDDSYDLIFVVMQYNQVLEIIPELARNISRYIVLVGNNMEPAYCLEQICSQSATAKEVAFGFQGTGGRRENGKVISMHFKVGMTIGGLTERLNSEFQNRIITVFEKTGYQLTWEHHMEGWLLSHVAHILPTAYICYSLDCNLKRANKRQIGLVIDAVVEAYQMLKKLGYPIRPDGEEEAYDHKRKKKQRLLYLMVKTSAGKYVISNHCAHAVSEMSALDQKFEQLKEKAGLPMPAWDQLRKEAMIALSHKQE